MHSRSFVDLALNLSLKHDLSAPVLCLKARVIVKHYHFDATPLSAELYCLF